MQFSSHLQTKNLICKDSIIKVVGLDDKSGGTCVVTQGRTAANAQPLYYRNCTFIASRCIVSFGDGYSIGSNHHFENCKFERVGTNPDFHTFALNRGWSDRHVFLDCEFGPGTKYNDVSWDGRSRRRITPLPGRLQWKPPPVQRLESEIGRARKSSPARPMRMERSGRRLRSASYGQQRANPTARIR